MVKPQTMAKADSARKGLFSPANWTYTLKKKLVKYYI
jgi:hypothetical protein